jgi:hypothetical protein
MPSTDFREDLKRIKLQVYSQDSLLSPPINIVEEAPREADTNNNPVMRSHNALWL